VLEDIAPGGDVVLGGRFVEELWKLVGLVCLINCDVGALIAFRSALDRGRIKWQIVRV
jgi:hypothetical protein